MTNRPSAPWFETAFGADYLAVYPHRNDAEAERHVRFLMAQCPLVPGGRALDLACGAGRHARFLLAAGWDVTGVDLSLPLLTRAADGPLAGRLVRADMRWLPLRAQFELVASFFSSFGYFADDAENQRVLAGISAVLVPGGSLFLDYLNADHVRASLVPCDERQIDGRTLTQERWITADGKRVEKRVRLAGLAGAAEYTESVRLYAADELFALFRAAGLSVTDAWGDFTGVALGPTQPRLIVLARKAAGRQICPTSRKLDGLDG